MEDMKNFISDFQKLNYFHTDFIHYYLVLMNYRVYDENLYEYVTEIICQSKPDSEDINTKENLHALAVV